MILAIILGVIAGFAAGKSSRPSETVESMQRDIAAYDECMALAGSMGCRMTPEDFIDYYDLKYRLLQVEE